MHASYLIESSPLLPMNNYCFRSNVTHSVHFAFMLAGFWKNEDHCNWKRKIVTLPLLGNLGLGEFGRQNKIWKKKELKKNLIYLNRQMTPKRHPPPQADMQRLTYAWGNVLCDVISSYLVRMSPVGINIVRSWREYGYGEKKTTLHCWQEHKLILPLQRTL